MIAIFWHIYYYDVARLQLDYLNNVSEPFDLWVNITEPETTEDKTKAKSLEATIHERFPNAVILYSPNQGRDIGGFFNLLSNCNKVYSTWAFIHTKKSEHIAEVAKRKRFPFANGGVWRDQLMGVLMGTPQQVHKCHTMLDRPGIGIVGLKRMNLRYVGKNEAMLKRLCRRYGIEYKAANFIAGTMFWARGDILSRIRNLGITQSDFETDNNSDLDATLAHAWERMFSLIARDMGYKTTGI